MLDLVIAEITRPFTSTPLVIVVVRLLAATLFGAIIGFERGWLGKPAGLRTHILVSTAACLFTLVGQSLGDLPFGDGTAISVDPTRLIQAVTAGVAFLAAGIILNSGGKVRNLTTGASMWMSGAIGLACGAGQIALAFMATLLVIAVVLPLGRLDAKVMPDQEGSDDEG